MICQSYCNTYGVPLMVMNVMNAFGERQHPEKFIPLCISKISKGEKLTIHSYTGSAKAGSRFYIHARNIAGAVLFVLKNGALGEKYNVEGEREVDNLEVAQFVAASWGCRCSTRCTTTRSRAPGTTCVTRSTAPSCATWAGGSH
jgi:dTDP-glucose 4,6-dehydratase